MQPDLVNLFQSHVMDGQWEEALGLLEQLSSKPEALREGRFLVGLVGGRGSECTPQKMRTLTRSSAADPPAKVHRGFGIRRDVNCSHGTQVWTGVDQMKESPFKDDSRTD